MTPDDLVQKYGGDAARFEETIDLSAPDWEEGRARDDLARWGVGAAVLADDRVLLVRQRDRWMLPGGMLEHGESHAEGAVREVYEETGIPVEIEALGAVVEQTVRNAATGETVAFAFAAFRARPRHTRITDDPGLADEDIQDVGWHATLPVDTYQPEMVATLVDG